MNGKQRVTFCAVLALIAVNAAFPPRVHIHGNSSTTRGFILLHINDDREYRDPLWKNSWTSKPTSIDLPRLLAQTIILLAVGGICVVCLEGNLQVSSPNPEGASTKSEFRGTK
jgi:hypothetical protein